MYRSIVSLALTLAVACSFQHPLRAGADAFRIWDFASSAPNYGYEGWSDLGGVGKMSGGGWEVNGPSAGGAGIIFHQLLNLENATKLRLVLEKCESNTDAKMFIKLISTDDRFVVYAIPLSEVMPGGMDPVEIDMSAPHEQSGESPDLSAIQQIQIQGSFNPGGRTHVRLGLLEAITD